MKKLKFIVACLVSLVLLSSVALAAIPSGTVVIGDKAYDLNYANDPANYDEIRDAIVNSNGQVYVKKFSGEWINNNTGGSAQSSEIPAVTYKDAEGNVKDFAAGDGDEIPEDTVAPEITISGVEDGKSYNKPVTPVVTLNEEGTIEMTLNDEEYDGSEITEDGTYTLVVNAADLTGNKSSKTITFTIKTSAPEAPVVAGVEDGKVYASVTPVFEGTATLNDEEFISGTVVDAEGVYKLVVTIEDEAGNKASTTINFAIDTTVPQIESSKVKNYQTLEVVFSEPVQGTPSVRVNDESTGFTVELAEDKMSLLVTKAAGFGTGTYVVIVNGLTDLAGNPLAANAYTLIQKAASAIASVEFTSTGFKVGEAPQKVHFTAVDQYGQPSANYASISFTASIGDYPLSNPTKNRDGTISIHADNAIVNGTVITVTAKVDNKVVGSAAVTASNQAAVATTFKSMEFDTPVSLEPTKNGLLRVVVFDQYNRPMDLALGAIKWVTSDSTKASFEGSTFKDADEVVEVNFVSSGTVTITAYLTSNIGLNISKTFTIGELPLNALNTATTIYNGNNNEAIKTTAIKPNDGATLTADILKYNLDSGKAEDVQISVIVEKNDIKFSIKTLKAGTYKFTPYVGDSLAKAKAKGPQITVTTNLNSTVASIDDISFDSKELKVGTGVTKQLIFRNKHGENINSVIDPENIVLTAIPADKITIAELARNAKNEISFKLTGTAAGTYQFTVAYGTEYKTYNLTFVAPVFSNIKGVDSITSGVVAGDPDDKAKYDDLIFYDQDGVSISVPRTDLVVGVKKDGIAMADPTLLIQIGKVTKNASGKVTAFDDAAVDINGFKVLADASLVPGTYTVTINKKNAAAISTTFNIVVGTKRYAETITVTSIVSKMTLGSSQVAKIEVKDQYGELINAVDDNITASLSVAGLIDDINVVKDGDVGKYKATITAKTDKKGSANLTFKTKTKDNKDISFVVGITVGSIAELVDEITIIGDTKLKSSRAAAGSVQLGLTAKDASSDAVTINYADTTYVVWSATAKAANGAAIADGFSVSDSGLVLYDKDFVGTITVTAMSSNFKTATFDVKVDNAAPVADKTTLALKADGKVVTSITLKNADATKVITLSAKDQYGADYQAFGDDFDDIIVMSADTTIVTATKNADGTLTITRVAKGATKVYVQYKGTNLVLDVNITD